MRGFNASKVKIANACNSLNTVRTMMNITRSSLLQETLVNQQQLPHDFESFLSRDCCWGQTSWLYLDSLVLTGQSAHMQLNQIGVCVTDV